VIGRIGAAVVLATLAPAGNLISGKTTSAAPAANPEAKWNVPRTPWGHPDIQGIWTSTGMRFVPLERAPRFGMRGVLNEEEAARRDKLSPDNGPTITPDINERKAHTSRQASLVVDPPDGRIPLTPVALETLKEREREWLVENPERSSPGTGEPTNYELSGGPLWRNSAPGSAADVDLWDRCISRGLPGVMVPTAYNNAIHILQTPDHVAIRYELLTLRIIPLDGRPHLGSTIRHWDGNARARWAGDTLVVESTNFKQTQGYVRQYGSFDGGSDDMRLVERFTRVGRDTIRYEGTIIDPKIFAAPWTIGMSFEKEDTYRMYEYACHEGNYSMNNRLSGARADSATKR
jgi:hypothetical protein